MKHILIEHIAAYPYRYHIHVMTGSEYAGEGAFCKNLQEVVGFMNAHEITEWKYIYYPGRERQHNDIERT